MPVRMLVGNLFQLLVRFLRWTGRASSILSSFVCCGIFAALCDPLFFAFRRISSLSCSFQSSTRWKTSNHRKFIVRSMIQGDNLNVVSIYIFSSLSQWNFSSHPL
ncbi:hypothetical protein F5050DRAFT_279142 [Lentinula boryana]|uniref:Secreted protein n=1 Tax=Lentinula boryana TaxID=40481 RepID=A0ABQ8QAH9_9AGAR|nr:hypothetical protein F5050DRAFT_279142 [Lentinula boryana]